MRLPIFIVAALAVLVLSMATETAEPQRTGPFGRAPVAPYSKHAQIGAYGRAVYPKYYWGLHAREFQNAGIPHGDIGIGGSGLTRNPW